MKAAVYYETGAPEVLRYEDVPDPVAGPGTVLIEIAAISIDASRNGSHVIDPHDPSEQSRPGHALEQAEQRRRVQLALSRLSPEHRTVLVMKDMEGQKYETMAEVLQVPIGTIRSRLHRARLELRDLLEREEA